MANVMPKNEPKDHVEDDVDAGDDDDGSDGVWTKEIEEAFEEALSIYPPCGRRKIIVSEQGKMYGRNELIAMHIFHKTGKQRSRKQVSSHIQVLARKKQRETRGNVVDYNGPQNMFDGLSSAEIVTQSVTNSRGRPGSNNQVDTGLPQTVRESWVYHGPQGQGQPIRVLMGHFSGYIQYPNGRQHNFVQLNRYNEFLSKSIELVDILQIYDKFPGLRELYAKGPQQSFYLVRFWVDLSYEVSMTTQGFFGIDSTYLSTEGMPIECSTSVISLGKQVVEKIQTDQPTHENGKFVYKFQNSPMCPYMISFIEKLRLLGNAELMNRVLENFSVVQVVRDLHTQDVLFVCAYLFAITTPNLGTRHTVYKLHELSQN